MILPAAKPAIPAILGVEVNLSLPGCRCGSTNGSSTPDQPCIGGGFGLWPTHGLIRRWTGVISPSLLSPEISTFPQANALKLKKATPAVSKFGERDVLFVLELLICLPLWSQRRAIRKQQKHHNYTMALTSHMKLDLNIFSLFLQWAWLKQGHLAIGKLPRKTPASFQFILSRPPQSESATPPEARKKVHGKSRFQIRLILWPWSETKDLYGKTHIPNPIHGTNGRWLPTVLWMVEINGKCTYRTQMTSIFEGQPLSGLELP